MKISAVSVHFHFHIDFIVSMDYFSFGTYLKCTEINFSASLFERKQGRLLANGNVGTNKWGWERAFLFVSIYGDRGTIYISFHSFVLFFILLVLFRNFSSKSWDCTVFLIFFSSLLFWYEITSIKKRVERLDKLMIT